MSRSDAIPSRPAALQPFISNPAFAGKFGS